MAWLNNRRTLAVATLVVAFVFLIGLNALSNNIFRSAAVDFTEDNIFTLTPGTKKVLAEMDEPVTLRFFISPKLAEVVPTYGAYAARVQAVLQQYARLSNGKIRLEIYRPVPFSVEEDRAVAYGLRGAPVDQSGELVFFGLVGTNTTDDQKTIAFFHPSRERFIEFDLTRMIRSLATPRKAVVGLISTLPIQGRFSMRGMVRPWAIYSEIKDQFDVRPLTDPDRIPKDIQVLMVVHPFRLPEKTLYAIDQFVLAGGKTMIFVDPVPDAAPRRRTMMGPGPTSPGSDIPRLFKSWGIELVKDKVVGDIQSAIRVRAKVDGRDVVAPYVVWMQLGADNMNPNDVVTRGLKQTIFATAGAIRKLKDAKTKVTPLVWTRKHASLIDSLKVRFRPDVVSLYRNYETNRRAYAVAVRITGKPDSAFPDGNPVKPKKDEKKAGDGKKKDAAKKPGDAKDKAAKDKAAKDKAAKDKKKDEPPAHLKAAAKPVNVIVVADIDWLTQNFWQTASNFFGQQITLPTSDNANFVMNALDSLSGNDAFIGLRAKGGDIRRPFTKIDQMKAEASSKVRSKLQELDKEQEETRKKLAAARARSKGGQLVLTPAEREEIRGYIERLLRIRQEVRRTRFEEQKGIDREESKWKFINIGLLPLLICGLALIVGVARHRRRRRRRSAA